jgi:hypothetical protein
VRYQQHYQRRYLLLGILRNQQQQLMALQGMISAASTPRLPPLDRTKNLANAMRQYLGTHPESVCSVACHRLFIL